MILFEVHLRKEIRRLVDDSRWIKRKEKVYSGNVAAESSLLEKGVYYGSIRTTSYEPSSVTTFSSKRWGNIPTDATLPDFQHVSL